MRLGIGSYTYPWAVGVPGHEPPDPLDAEGFLELAIAHGVGVVQLCDNLPLVALGERALDRFVGRALEAGLLVEVGTRGLEPGNLEAHLRLAERLGSGLVRLVIDRGADEPTPAEAVARLRPLLAGFKASGVRLALENHDRFRARTLVGMVQSLGPDLVGVCLDTVNSFGALEGPGVVVAELAPHALSLHLKDFRVVRAGHQMGFSVEGRPAGGGMLDVPWLLAAVRAAGQDPNAILELWTPPAGSLQATLERERHWADESLAYLRPLFSRPGDGPAAGPRGAAV